MAETTQPAGFGASLLNFLSNGIDTVAAAANARYIAKAAQADAQRAATEAAEVQTSTAATAPAAPSVPRWVPLGFAGVGLWILIVLTIRTARQR